MTVVIDSSFDPVPSLALTADVVLGTAADVAEAPAYATFVTAEGDLPSALDGLTRESLKAAGFTGAAGQTLRIPGASLRVLVGVGKGIASTADLRDAVAAFTRAAGEVATLGVDLAAVVTDELSAHDAALAATEGAVLARYRFEALKSEAKTVALEKLVLGVGDADRDSAQQGVDRALVLSRIAGLARDLGNAPPRHLNAVRFAELSEELGSKHGLEVEVFDHDALVELGTGGLLGVNAGSTEEPRMVKLRYVPEGATEETPHLALVGKGIMFDSGGISLKPANSMGSMKMDMMGAGAVLAAMTSFRELGVKSVVTGWLMCTDNMLSGTATKIGDVLTMRGGKTVEVKNSDAEGRLVMADGLVLATEEERRPDAIVDIATLTGNAMAALGLGTAATLSNNEDVAEQLSAAAKLTDERIWPLPLDHRYREQLKSNIADLSNIGGPLGGAILAALFLNEFVDDLPWGHLDIAATMEVERDDLWRSQGSTGFGARLLAEFAAAFEAPTVEESGEGTSQSEAN
ncbi:leucyl aminopeptidase family protein [Leucobacter denitrificans]|uniref:Probable cytosol aminopeptidase n=1 Tax=Leucobacter denitrificans TaxID=683042 RepID=A0A7G9S702_9MICO|nr:leucyl aminopeptidase [Leucobacter denitrificans]QNN63627.1 leucyl aminopeptidase [Leucobacter denitrificans]